MPPFTKIMREIKFRGWRLDEKQWVFGGVHIVPDDALIIERRRNNDCFHSPVVPESIGQFTGLHDKNGVEIYEGDIVRYKDFQRFRDDEYERVEAVEYVVEQRVGFAPMVWHTDVEDGYYNSEREDYEVIGNIHANPDLLK